MLQQPFSCLQQGGGWLATVHHRVYVCRYVCVYVWVFTLETSCRPVRVPAASSPRGPLVFRCLVRRISNCVRWGISVRIDRSSAQHSTGPRSETKSQGAKEPISSSYPSHLSTIFAPRWELYSYIPSSPTIPVEKRLHEPTAPQTPTSAH